MPVCSVAPLDRRCSGQSNHYHLVLYELPVTRQQVRQITCSSLNGSSEANPNRLDEAVGQQHSKVRLRLKLATLVKSDQSDKHAIDEHETHSLRHRFPGIEIVGEIANGRTDDLTQKASPEVYLPLWQAQAFSKHLVVRTAADPRAVIVETWNAPCARSIQRLLLRM